MPSYSATLALLASSLHAVALHTSLTATQSSFDLGQVGRASQRKIFFLFMADDHVPHADIWDRFFSHAKKGVDYEVLLHCQQENACRKRAGALGKHFSPELVPTVPSKYCTNLIDPMLALLKHALKLDPSQGAPDFDQFVFVSDTTVPIKPFSNVSAMLRGEPDDPTSRFCVEPWSIGKHAYNGTAVLVKHSQWMTVGRADGEKLLSREFMYQKTIDIGAIGGEGCSDEYWFFAVLYGLLKPHYGESFYNAMNRLEGVSQKCDTFVDWEHQFIDSKMPVPKEIPYGPAVRTLPTDLRSKGDHAGKATSVAQLRRGVLGPAEVREFSRETFLAWRASPWSFLRKVKPNVRIAGLEGMKKADAFSRYIFDEGVRLDSMAPVH